MPAWLSGGALVFGAGLALLGDLYFATRLAESPSFGGLHPDRRWARRSETSLDKPLGKAGWTQPAAGVGGPRAVIIG